MNLINYTTAIAADKSIASIQKSLSSFGAQSVAIDYTGGNPSGLRFSLMHENEMIIFALPCNAIGVFNILAGKNIAQKYKTQQHALKVAWRILKTWIEAQLSMVAVNMATMTEVFLPFAMLNGTTLYTTLQAKGRLKELN